MEEPVRTKYTIKPTYKKSALEEQYWCNSLQSGKSVSVKVNNVYRWGEFYIELTDKEKQELLKKEMVNLSEYDHELIEMWDGGCDFWIDIVNDEDFSEEELEEIESLLYEWKKDEDTKVLSIIPEDEYGGEGEGSPLKYGGEGSPLEDDEGYSYEKMEHNGWCETECEYVITSSCELDKVMEYESQE